MEEDLCDKLAEQLEKRGENKKKHEQIRALQGILMLSFSHFLPVSPTDFHQRPQSMHEFLFSIWDRARLSSRASCFFFLGEAIHMFFMGSSGERIFALRWKWPLPEWEISNAAKRLRTWEIQRKMASGLNGPKNGCRDAKKVAEIPTFSPFRWPSFGPCQGGGGVFHFLSHLPGIFVPGRFPIL